MNKTVWALYLRRLAFALVSKQGEHALCGKSNEQKTYRMNMADMARRINVANRAAKEKL
jgi:hypothetical protein